MISAESGFYTVHVQEYFGQHSPFCDRALLERRAVGRLRVRSAITPATRGWSAIFAMVRKGGDDDHARGGGSAPAG
jgi:hypothetical protein